MNVAANKFELDNYLNQAARLGISHPVVISKFILNAKDNVFEIHTFDLSIYIFSNFIFNIIFHSLIG